MNKAKQPEPETLEGCYGAKVSYEELDVFLDDAFARNFSAEKSESERFASCIWGSSGIGKTACIKKRKTMPVDWCGKRYDGYDVVSVPLAQFEEMGDLHGMPETHVLVRGPKDKKLWIPEKVLSGYLKAEWEVLHEEGVRTMYAPPEWVPTKPGPSILLMDDWNKASPRIIKGVLQLFQDYRMMSWQLPPGCNVVLTGNPDNREYLVTSLDPSMLSRLRSVTMVFDASASKQWAVWAAEEKLDSRGIYFVLMYPEMAIGVERTNPRTLTEFFRFLKGKDLTKKSERRRVEVMAHALLDPQTVDSMMVFFDRDVEMMLGPELILSGDERVGKKIESLMTRKEKRVDVLAVMCDRLFAHVASMETVPTEKQVANFQAFLLHENMEPDLRHNMCLRIYRHGRQEWLKGNKELIKKTIEVL